MTIDFAIPPAVAVTCICPLCEATVVSVRICKVVPRELTAPVVATTPVSEFVTANVIGALNDLARLIVMRTDFARPAPKATFCGLAEIEKSLVAVAAVAGAGPSAVMPSIVATSELESAALASRLRGVGRLARFLRTG